MRSAFIQELISEASHNKNIWLLTADLGYSFLEPFAEAFPDRFVNVGVAEQNMISIAAGLAMSGKKVFVYSIINFLTFRCLEQIRNDVCYHDLDVHFIGVGAGFSYEAAGYSHYGIEDIALMKGMPRMRIFSPADGHQTMHIMKKVFFEKGPSYLRLGKKARVHTFDPIGSIDKGLIYHEGKEVTCFCLGEILWEVLEMTKMLSQKHKRSFCVISLPMIYPLNDEILMKAATETKKILIFEEHKASGLTAIILEALMKHRLKIDVETFCVAPDATQKEECFLQNQMLSFLKTI